MDRGFCRPLDEELELASGRFFEQHGEVVKTKVLRDGRGNSVGLT